MSTYRIKPLEFMDHPSKSVIYTKTALGIAYIGLTSFEVSFGRICSGRKFKSLQKAKDNVTQIHFLEVGRWLDIA
jgi:hypothetical protein